jgi:hypothetical protein
MGTRSLTFVYDEQDIIINMYRQYDGYPTGHGAELAEFLSQFRMTNGIPVGRDKTGDRIANGMGCLAAQLVSNFKGSDAGQFYLYPATATDCGQDYEYHVYKDEGGLRVRITDRGCNMFGLTMSDKNDAIFDGTVAEFTKFCTEKEEFEVDLTEGQAVGL